MHLVISRYDFCHSTGTHTFGGLQERQFGGDGTPTRCDTYDYWL